MATVKAKVNAPILDVFGDKIPVVNLRDPQKKVMVKNSEGNDVPFLNDKGEQVYEWNMLGECSFKEVAVFGLRMAAEKKEGNAVQTLEFNLKCAKLCEKILEAANAEECSVELEFDEAKLIIDSVHDYYNDKFIDRAVDKILSA
jgi:hypothetical protein